MISRGSTTRRVALVLALGSPVWALPPAQQVATGEIAGTVLGLTPRAPLVGARVYAADPATGKIYASAPSTAEGAFAISGLPAAEFDVAVAVEQGLYLVERSVRVAPAGKQRLNLAVHAAAEGASAAPAPQGSKPPAKGVWNNPLTASLIVVGGAIVVGFLVEQATSSGENETSPFQ